MKISGLQRTMLTTYSGGTSVSESKKKILEYRWSRIKRKILDERLWQVSQHGKGFVLIYLVASKLTDKEQHGPNRQQHKARRRGDAIIFWRI